MHNGYDDEFATTLADLVDGPPQVLVPARVKVPAEFDWSLAVDGDAADQWVESEVSTDPIDLQFDLQLTHEAECTYALGWTYLLSPLVSVKSVTLMPGPGALMDLTPYQFVDELQARHGRAFGFCLFRTLGPQATTSLTLSLMVARAPDIRPAGESVVDIDLSHFVLYKLFDYTTVARYTNSTEPTDFRPSGLPTGDGRRLQEEIKQLKADTYDVDVTLKARQDAGPELHFRGSVDVGSSRTLMIEFPLLAADDPVCNWSILPYLANLAHYGYPAGPGRRRVLSYAERLALDANNPRLYDGGGDAPKGPLGPRPVFRWAQRLLHMQASQQGELGGAELVRVAPLLRLCQDQGVSLIFADTDRIGRASYEMLKRYDLMRVITSFNWEDVMKVEGEGQGASGTGLVAVTPPAQPRSSNLFKNPVQFDTAVLTSAARAFAEAHPSMVAVDLPHAGELLVGLPEMGDTWAPMPFLLPASGPDAARRQALLDELAAYSYRMPPRGLGANYPLGMPIAFRLHADATYHQAYWQHLTDEYNDRTRYWSAGGAPFAAVGGIPTVMLGPAQAFIDNLHDLTDLFCSPATATDLALGSQIFDDVTADYSRFADITPGNGPHDLCEYGTASLPSRPMSERRAQALGSTSGRVQWYCQFRHWVRTNIAYVESAVGALKQALHGAPHLTYTSLSKPVGYWGFESYHTVRSGALDIVWLHDDFARENGASQKHLVFNGVLADFARALSRLPTADKSPFSPSKRPLGVYPSNERVDIKAMVWASRGARYFECAFSSDVYSIDPGWGNAGDLAYQPLAQGRSAMQVLHTQQSFFERAERVLTRIALIVPQTASIWSIGDGDGDLKGFAPPDLLDKDFCGQHAMFTHAQLPVDLIFEEAIVDDLIAGMPLLNRYNVLCVSTAFLRDDVFHALATWVMDGGILVLAQGPVQADVGNESSAAVRFNEFAQDRGATRGEWLTHGELVASPDASTTLRRAGNGCILDLGVRHWGEDYIDALDIVFGHLLPPGPLGAMGAATRHREAFIALIDQALAVNSKPPRALLDSRSAWVTSAPGSPDPVPPVVEVVDLRRVGTSAAVSRPATQGAVVVINHRHRNYQHAAWLAGLASRFGPLDPATADIPREPTLVTLHLKGMGPTVGVSIAPDPTGTSRKITRDADGIVRVTFALGDYAVVGWKRGTKNG